MYQHIIAAIDGSPHADKAMLQAGWLAHQMGARLTLVHIVNLQSLAQASGGLISTPQLHAQAQARGRTLLSKAQYQLRSEIGIETDTHLGESWHDKRDMAGILARFAEATDADLLVLATHGRSGLMHMLMGSFSENVLRVARCPLMIVRSEPGASTP
jgi:nucleotide-binding universal stress UspA family protein